MNGRLGKAEAGNASFVTLYAAPPEIAHAVANVLVVNTNNVEATITIAIAQTTAPNTNEFIEYNYPLPPNGHLERSALVISPGEIILVYANMTGVVCRAHGFEKGAA